MENVRWRCGGKPFLVDKLPSNFINIGYIRLALPHACIIHIQRDPMDLCFSNLKELYSNACPYSYDQQELADYLGSYRKLMSNWHDLFPGKVFDVSYEALTADPAAETRKIFEHFGLAWEENCLDVKANAMAVNTASAAQVRQTIANRSKGSWQRYARFLTPLRDNLLAQGIIIP